MADPTVKCAPNNFFVFLVLDELPDQVQNMYNQSDPLHSLSLSPSLLFIMDRYADINLRGVSSAREDQFIFGKRISPPRCFSQ